MYITRSLEKAFLNANSYYPVIALCGQRQVGKSTMLNHIKTEDKRYVTLDDRNALQLALNDPELFFETYGTNIIIDEFQRAPDILIEIKRIIDKAALEGKNINGNFWLTGSQKFLMMKGLSESLAGRVGIFTLSSFSVCEINKKIRGLFTPDIDVLKRRETFNSLNNIHSVFEHIFKGGMPKLHSSEIPRERFFMDYINTYLERDIHD